MLNHGGVMVYSLLVAAVKRHVCRSAHSRPPLAMAKRPTLTSKYAGMLCMNCAVAEAVAAANSFTLNTASFGCEQAGSWLIDHNHTPRARHHKWDLCKHPSHGMAFDINPIRTDACHAQYIDGCLSSANDPREGRH